MDIKLNQQNLDIREILSTTCKISFDNGHNWINATITHIEAVKNTAQIFVRGHITDDGEQILVKFLNKNIEYILVTYKNKCTYLPRKYRLIDLLIDKVVPFVNDREHKRFVFNCPSNIYYDNKTSDATLCNISLGGAQFISKKMDITEGQNVSLEVFVRDDKRLCFSGEVASKSKVNFKTFVYGIKINEVLTEEDQNDLNELIDILAVNETEILIKLKLLRKMKLISTIALLVVFIIVMIRSVLR
jgi:hypothetical protein